MAMCAEFGVDYIALETMRDYGEASLALEICRKYGE